MLSPNDCELDHMMPLSRGGLHTRDNVQLVAAMVNQAKGAMNCDEFIQLCVDVATHSASVASD